MNWLLILGLFFVGIIATCCAVLVFLFFKFRKIKKKIPPNMAELNKNELQAERRYFEYGKTRTEEITGKSNAEKNSDTVAASSAKGEFGRIESEDTGVGAEQQGINGTDDGNGGNGEQSELLDERSKLQNGNSNSSARNKKRIKLTKPDAL